MQKLPLIVRKAWGCELWLINEPEYCLKRLEIKKGASGSLHYHPVKKETFMVLGGKIKLEYGDKTIKMTASLDTVTILPGVSHRFTGLKDSSILEISTHHDDNDVVRLEVSKA